MLPSRKNKTKIAATLFLSKIFGKSRSPQRYEMRYKIVAIPSYYLFRIEWGKREAGWRPSDGRLYSHCILLSSACIVHWSANSKQSTIITTRKWCFYYCHAQAQFLEEKKTRQYLFSFSYKQHTHDSWCVVHLVHPHRMTAQVAHY